MKHRRKKPYFEKNQTFSSKKIVFFLGILFLGVMVLWRPFRHKKPLIIQGKGWPECIDIPQKKRRQYGVYNQILSKEKDQQVVHLLPPDTVPALDELGHDGDVSVSKNEQKPLSPPTHPAKSASDAKLPFPVPAFKGVHKTTSQSQGRNTALLRLRIGKGFPNEKSAQDRLNFLKHSCPWAKGVEARVYLLSSKDLLFAPFLWGFSDDSVLDAYIQCLKKKSISYSVIKQ